MKDIEFMLKLQGDAPMVLCSLFENPFTVQEYNQGVIALVFAPQMRPCTNHIMIKYHHFHIFLKYGDVEIQNVDTKEQIADIFYEATRF